MSDLYVINPPAVPLRVLLASLDLNHILQVEGADVGLRGLPEGFQAEGWVGAAIYYRQGIGIEDLGLEADGVQEVVGSGFILLKFFFELNYPQLV